MIETLIQGSAFSVNRKRYFERIFHKERHYYRSLLSNKMFVEKNKLHENDPVIMVSVY